jgi:DNA-binding MurR/RpiR family transcriptional regulator
MSAAQRTVAAYVADRPGEVVFLGVRELARRTGTSTATVVRLAQALGFSGYLTMLEQLQHELLEQIHPTARLASTLEDLRRSAIGDDDLLRHVFEQDGNSLRETANLVAAEEFGRAVDILAAARIVYLCGAGLSAAPVHTLAVRLRRLGIPTITAEASGPSLYNVVLPVAADDAMVAVASQPVPRELVAVARFATERGAAVIAITDTQVSSLQRHARVTLHAKRGPLTQLTSVVAPVAIANALAVGLAARLEKQAAAMYAAVEELQSQSRSPEWPDKAEE